MVTEYEIEDLFDDAVRRCRTVEALRRLAELIERGTYCMGFVKVSSDGAHNTRWLSPSERQIQRYSLDRVVMDVKFLNEGEWVTPTMGSQS